MDFSSNINADVPIKTINDDELNRADFSIRVAESILNMIVKNVWFWD